MFKEKAKEIIEQAVSLRLFLIETGKSKNEITRFQCEKIREDISTFQNDKQYSSFLIQKGDLLERMMPGPNKASKKRLISLIEEAKMVKR